MGNYQNHTFPIKTDFAQRNPTFQLFSAIWARNKKYENEEEKNKIKSKEMGQI